MNIGFIIGFTILSLILFPVEHKPCNRIEHVYKYEYNIHTKQQEKVIDYSIQHECGATINE